MDNGWIKLHRCLIEKAIWKQSQAEQKAVLITILLLANHNSKQWIWSGEKFSVLPGQFITSLDLLAKKSGVSVRSVRTALKNFEKLDFLTNESTKSGRLVTVVNWSLYQSEDELPTKIPTKHRQSTDKAPTTNKNDKNDKKINTSCRKNKFSDDQMSIAKFFVDKIRVNLPDFKTPNLEQWANDVRMMMDIDGRTEDQIRYLIDWTQKDGFWWKNIMSVAKLRKQYDRLAAEVKSKKTILETGNKYNPNPENLKFL